MSEGFRIEAPEADGYVAFQAAGDRAAGAFRCSECGYGVTCPMCRGTAWERSAWSPFVRAAQQRPE